MTIPQLRAMAQGDRARKNNLIKYWFRLPSAIDHRPLRFEELEATLHRKSLDDIQLDQATDHLHLVSATHIQTVEKEKKSDSSLINREAREQNQLLNLRSKQKRNAKSIFLSATPAQYEIDISEEIVEQIIRPTGLLDPITYVYPKSGNYQQLLLTIDKLLKKKPHLTEFLHELEPKESEKDILKEVFWEYEKDTMLEN
jgi:excinuclease UvrABC helicase subunit UvrB